MSNCIVCREAVNPLESIADGKRIYHKNCFKCSSCENKLTLSKHDLLDGKPYCIDCFDVKNDRESQMMELGSIVALNVINNKGKNGGKWPNGEIYYKINIPESEGIYNIVQDAIEEWNNTVGKYCRFIKREEPKHTYGVDFVFDPSKPNPSAIVGCHEGKTTTITIMNCYNSNPYIPVKKSCVLHEMMHSAGFMHEHSRVDRVFHCQVLLPNDDNYKCRGVCIGNYDYYSLMHYEEIQGQMVFGKNNELRRLAGRSNTFSNGDIAAIKIVYAPKGTHHGEWHDPNNDPNNPSIPCSSTCCSFGTPPLPSLRLGSNCGYEGERGHWSCCMSEGKDLPCITTHTGFWHAKCTANCTKPRKKICSCENCGGGCAYKGTNAHWSCCSNENLSSQCINNSSYKKEVPDEVLFDFKVELKKQIESDYDNDLQNFPRVMEFIRKLFYLDHDIAAFDTLLTLMKNNNHHMQPDNPDHPVREILLLAEIVKQYMDITEYPNMSVPLKNHFYALKCKFPKLLQLFVWDRPILIKNDEYSFLDVPIDMNLRRLYTWIRETGKFFASWLHSFVISLTPPNLLLSSQP